MKLKLNAESGAPIYAQIVEQVEYLIASGRLSAGDAMPAIRTLAEQLLVNPNTVARAYRELEHAGLIESRVGAGTVVSRGVSPLARRERLRILNEQIDVLLAKASQLNFSVDELQGLIEKRAQEMRQGEGNQP